MISLIIYLKYSQIEYLKYKKHKNTFYSQFCNIVAHYSYSRSVSLKEHVAEQILSLTGTYNVSILNVAL